MNPGILGLITALCWGTGDFAARYTSRAIGPAQTLLVLFGVSTLAMAPLVLSGNLDLLWEPATLALSLGAGFVTTIAVLLLFMSLAHGPIGVVVPVTSSYPLPLILITMAMGKLSLSLPLSLAMVATIGGVWIVARAGKNIDYQDHARGPIGRAVILAGTTAIIFSVAVLLTEAAVSRAGEIEVVWFTRAVGFVTLIVFLGLGKRLSPISGRIWLLLIAMGLVDMAGYIALFTAHGTGDTAIAAVTSATYGVVTIGLARIILKEPVRPLQWFGFIIVIVGAASLILLNN
ncbi:MAG: DMT family transporter [Rhodospirillaceae bacterium]|nr:DMT family transporter [Rhodospirillaceae bacterium]